MKEYVENYKKYIIAWIIITVLLGLARVYVTHTEQKKILPNERYIEIDGKVLDYDKFNTWESDEKYRSSICKMNAEHVMYIGDGQELPANFFELFPKAKEVSIRNCFVSNLEISNAKNLTDLELNNCTIAEGVQLASSKVKSLTLDYSKLGKMDINLPQLSSLVINYNDITEDIINNFAGCSNIDRLSLKWSTLDSISILGSVKNISCLNLMHAKVTDYSNLSMFNHLNEIYLDMRVNRSYVDFMHTHFKNGDMYTKAYFLGKKYNFNKEDKNM